MKTEIEIRVEIAKEKFRITAFLNSIDADSDAWHIDKTAREIVASAVCIKDLAYQLCSFMSEVGTGHDQVSL